MNDRAHLECRPRALMGFRGRAERSALIDAVPVPVAGEDTVVGSGLATSDDVRPPRRFETFIATDGVPAIRAIPAAPSAGLYGSNAAPADVSDRSRLYVVTRRDLPWSVRIVQSIHAALSCMHVRGEEIHAHFERVSPYGPALVLKAVPDEAALSALFERLPAGTAAFREPDLGEELTAVAFYGEEPSVLREVPLL